MPGKQVDSSQLTNRPGRDQQARPYPVAGVGILILTKHSRLQACCAVGKDASEAAQDAKLQAPVPAAASSQALEYDQR